MAKIDEEIRKNFFENFRKLYKERWTDLGKKRDDFAEEVRKAQLEVNPEHYNENAPDGSRISRWKKDMFPEHYLDAICQVLQCTRSDLIKISEADKYWKIKANVHFGNALEGHSINPAFLEFVTKVPGVADAFPFSDRVLETYPGYYITHGDREREKDRYFLESDDFSFIGADGTKRPLQGPDLHVVEEIQREVEDLIRLRLQQMKTTREREICDRIHEIEAASHRHVDKIKVSVDDAVNLAHPYQKAEALAETYKKKNPSNEWTEESLQLMFDKYHISPRAVLETTSSETVKEYCRQYIEEHDGITEDQARRFDAALSLDGFPQSCVLPD